MAYRGNEFITIGKLAERTGVAVSAVAAYHYKSASSTTPTIKPQN